MQVVYSGGSTPTPSPRVQRKLHQGAYSRPIFTGPGSCKSNFATVPRKESKERTDSVRTDAPRGETSLRDAIPAMKRPVAITCLVLNILLPGLGTFVSGLTVLCGSKVRFKSMSRQTVVCSNTWVAFLQFVTAFLFLLGWVWSIVWGVAFLTHSSEYYMSSKRHSMPLKNSLLTKSVDRGGNVNGSTSVCVNRTGSAPGLLSYSVSHLQKPLMLRSSSADQPTHPLIVLERPPNISHSETSLISRTLKCNKSDVISVTSGNYIKHTGTPKFARTSTDEEHGSSTKLEHIVLHNLPRAPVRGVLRREDTVTSTVSSVSEHET